MADAQEYTVEIEGFILGAWQVAGEPVKDASGRPMKLTAKQAQQFLREGRIKVPSKAAGKAKAKAD